MADSDEEFICRSAKKRRSSSIQQLSSCSEDDTRDNDVHVSLLFCFIYIFCLIAYSAAFFFVFRVRLFVYIQ